MPEPGKTRMTYGSYSFLPVPLFSVSSELVKSDNDETLSIRHQVDFAGFLLENTAIPSESGSFPNLYLRKELLRRALTESGVQEWRITYEGNVVESGRFPKVTSVAFEEGIWVDRIPYSFTFTYDTAISGVTPVKSFNESWDFSENDDRRSVTARHDISAVGVNTSGSVSNALINARTFVLARTGYSNVPAGHPVFVEGSGTLSAYEEKRTENADVQAGSFSVTEEFTLSSGNYLHSQNGQFSTDKDGITTVSLDGNIRGLGRGDSAYNRAIAAFRDIIRGNFPADASGVYIELGGESTLFTNTPESKSFTKSKFAGTIDYSITYTDNPSQNLPSGIQDFTISVQNDKPIRLFASFAIMERSLGNVVQDIATPTEGRYVISGSAVGKQDFAFASLVDFCEQRINDLKPIPANYITLRIDSVSITKDEEKKTVNFNVGYIYTKDLTSVLDSEDDIVLD